MQGNKVTAKIKVEISKSIFYTFRGVYDGRDLSPLNSDELSEYVIDAIYEDFKNLGVDFKLPYSIGNNLAAFLRIALDSNVIRLTTNIKSLPLRNINDLRNAVQRNLISKETIMGVKAVAADIYDEIRKSLFLKM